jgi:4-hydroxybenzoate polyprenyltransferase
VAVLALISLGVVLLALTGLSLRALPSAGGAAGVALTALLGWRLLPAYASVWRQPHAEAIRQAVRIGVLSLVLLDAVLGAVYAGPVYCAVILAVAFVAGSLARRFAVT